MLRSILLVLTVIVIAWPAVAQDVRGLEVCTAEKSMERRTGCLQSNVEFLQQALVKQARDTQARLDAAKREAASQRAEIAMLKDMLVKLQHELAELKKPKVEKK
jgi:hypothetical protein